jgi:hypothetical protein
MGMNYYLHENVCKHCGRGDPVPLHIGKSSAGWVFSLHVIPQIGINDLVDWERRWSMLEVGIKNENGEVLSIKEMRQHICDRLREGGWNGRTIPTGYKSWSEFHELNDSQRGPRGLLRHRIGNFCVSHGKRTWDCMAGDFS